MVREVLLGGPSLGLADFANSVAEGDAMSGDRGHKSSAFVLLLIGPRTMSHICVSVTPSPSPSASGVPAAGRTGGVAVVDLGEWLDIKEAAERKSVSDTTIRNHIKKGSLPSMKRLVTGRDGRMVVKRLIRASDLEKVFPRNSTTGSGSGDPGPMPPELRQRVLRFFHTGDVEEFKRETRAAIARAEALRDEAEVIRKGEFD